MLKKIIVFSFVIFFFSLNTVYSIEPDIFVQSTVNRASDTLSGNKTKEERIEELKQIALDTVDIKGIGFYSLGKHRKNLTSDKKNEYSKVFKDYFLNSFSSRLAEYSNPVIEVNSKEKINDNYTIVFSTLAATDKRPAIKIDWRIYTKNPDKPLIRDLIVEGLSLARTQKEEFASILNSNNNDIKILIDKLQEFANN